MTTYKDKSDCTGCNACFNICPKYAITMKEDKEGFKYPVINKDKCINCGLCEKICPVINYNSAENIEIPETIGAYSKDEPNRKESSSGGIFSELAKYILDKNGIVFGAGYDDNFNIIYKEVNNIKELNQIKGSKYVQSDTNDTYRNVKEYLEVGKYVLYSGTPCQIAGLYAYLNKKYDKLYTCDIICHGVPSPKVFRKYLQYIKKKNKVRIRGIYFRNKKYGWNTFSMKVEFDNKKEYINKLTKDKFMKMFLNNIILRPSCYKCKFSKLPRIADISLGDFWGVENKYEEFTDDKGTSLILINNDKGQELFDKVKHNLYYKENCDLEYAIKTNPCICSSVKEPEKRKEFFEDIDKLEFKELAKKYLPKEKFISKIYVFGIRALSKLKRLILKLFKR